MLIAIVPFLVAVVGALLFALSDGKASQMGKDMFWTGLLVTLLVVGTKVIKVG